MKKKNIKKRIFLILAIFIPMIIASLAVIFSTITQLNKHYKEITSSNNEQVRSFLKDHTNSTERTANLISEDEIFVFLNSTEFSEDNKNNAFSYLNIIDRRLGTILSDARIMSIEIYTSNDSLPENAVLKKITATTTDTSWYRTFWKRSTAFWEVESNYSGAGSAQNILSYHKKVYFPSADVTTYINININPNSLRSRIKTKESKTTIWLKDSKVFYSDENITSENNPFISILGDDYESDKTITTINDKGKINGQNSFYTISMIKPTTQTERFVIATENTEGTIYIKKVTRLYIIFVIIVIALMLLLLYIIFMRRIEQNEYIASLREQVMKTEQAKMEFRMLSSQINPHFLFNTLESIRMKAIRNGDRETANSIKLLGKSMRYALRGSADGETHLSDELSYINTYMEIQKMRFHENIELITRISPSVEAEKAEFIPLLLQPIVENGVLHGLHENSENGKIIIHIKLEIALDSTKGNENDLEISVFDNGEGMDKDTLEKLRDSVENHPEHEAKHIGLWNIEKRVHLTYGEAYGLTIQSKKRLGTMITLRIPYFIT